MAEVRTWFILDPRQGYQWQTYAYEIYCKSSGNDRATTRMGWDENTIVASFFFYNLGSASQKSQAGLLGSLVHQIISEDPSLVKIALPQLWQEVMDQPAHFLEFLSGRWYDWTLNELLGILKRRLSPNSSRARWCLFIDGLDEFDGDHQGVISIVNDLTATPNVKVCVSSRPLLVFEDEFQSCRELRLQDLTAPDIRIYVYSNLAKNRGF